jgi:photosystem II stability/assembly factor-like uncharacterized protein
LHSEALVHCIEPHPRDAQTVFAGTDLGLYRSDDGGANWTLLDTAMGKQAVWSVAFDEQDPDRMIAGTGTPDPAALFRSSDGGETWQRGTADVADTCFAVGVPRPLGLAIDPTNPKSAWAAFEVDGIRHSSDGGETWERVAPEIKNPDVHSVLVTTGPPKTVFVVVNDDVWSSTDDGATWRAANARQTFPWHHVRSIAARPDDPRTLFVTLGDSTPGRTGALMRSRDNGDTWETLELPSQPNTAMWTTAFSRTDPDLMFAASRYGNLYRSEDGGDSWVRLWREFSEVSSVAFIPSGNGS